MIELAETSGAKLGTTFSMPGSTAVDVAESDQRWHDSREGSCDRGSKYCSVRFHSSAMIVLFATIILDDTR